MKKVRNHFTSEINVFIKAIVIVCLLSFLCVISGSALKRNKNYVNSIEEIIQSESDGEYTGEGNSIALLSATDTTDVYLSDVQEVSAQVGWGTFIKDANASGNNISVKIEGAWYAFEKGLFTHAAATVIYNIENYTYDYFSAYVSLDKSRTQGDGVRFYVYTSLDGQTWNLRTNQTPTVFTPGAESEHIVVELNGATYLKLVVDCGPRNNNGSDHAVWADAKLTDYPEGSVDIKALSEYDTKIKEKVASSGVTNIGNIDIQNVSGLESLVLQRELVRKIGNYALKRFANGNEANKEVWNWLTGDVENLREFVLGGDPMQGSWYNALNVLSDLYRNYKNDLNDTTLLTSAWAHGRTKGNLYRTMMFSVALTHDGTVASWMQKDKIENQSDPLRRYAIYRFLYKNNRFLATTNEDGTPKYDTTPWFESLRVEEMRWIMYNVIDDESILWLNDYVQTRINQEPNKASNYHSPHLYIAYTSPNYSNPIYYAEENRSYFNELFGVDYRSGMDNDVEKYQVSVNDKAVTRVGMWDLKYTIPGGVDSATYTIKVSRTGGNDTTGTYNMQKVWMNFRNKFGTGSVCGGISKSGCNIRNVRGIPATVIGQPGHAAILAYVKNAEGKGYWAIDNNVGGWTVATKGERHLLGWGNATWQRKSATVVYFHLAQDALNDYDNLVKAEEYVMLGRVYEGDLAKQEALYEKALEKQSINLDAWYELLMTYRSQYLLSQKNESQLLDLAERIKEAMVGYPLPMYCLLNQLSASEIITTGVDKTLSDSYKFQHRLIQNSALTASSVLPNTATDKTLQPAVARVEASFLLGYKYTDNTVATFSFTGDNANNIVMSDAFNGMGFDLEYSLDGKNTWKTHTFTAGNSSTVQKFKLTEAELNAITEENGIYLRLKGDPQNNQENYYKIDISAAPVLPTNLYGNDWENKIIGINKETYEWRYRTKNSATGNLNDSDSDVWTAYSEQEPDCTGAKVVEVRIKASGTKPASNSAIFEFRKDGTTAKKQYVSIEHLEMYAFVSESQDSKRPNYAVNAIDGNANTYWHCAYNNNFKDKEKFGLPYLVVKLDNPRYVSGLEFAQLQYNKNYSIFAKNAKVYVSSDGNGWTEAGSLQDIEASEEIVSVDFTNSVYGQYVKLEMELYESADNKNDGVFTTVSMINIYEDITLLSDNENPSNKYIIYIVIGAVAVVVIIVGIVLSKKFKKSKSVGKTTNKSSKKTSTTSKPNTNSNTSSNIKDYFASKSANKSNSKFGDKNKKR